MAVSTAHIPMGEGEFRAPGVQHPASPAHVHGTSRPMQGHRMPATHPQGHGVPATYPQSHEVQATYADVGMLFDLEHRISAQVNRCFLDVQNQHREALASFRNVVEESLKDKQSAVVHEVCLKLLGDPMKKRSDLNPHGRAYYDLPEPLAPNEPPRYADDLEGTRLYNPQWRSPPSHPVNEEYINAATELLWQIRGMALTFNLCMPIHGNPSS
ncbi:hypothetical protein OBBRIDRAFT_798776 [Obba rivulosa]|uniref:Uncharacterized protein n=1 Tax=Obba rivulosa TaxID=1052685 RepID=A0A8E2DEG0_9APHY|nr:hypothetical protein OBBRIDRAFT_798776 [Obba rivulosa]